MPALLLPQPDTFLRPEPGADIPRAATLSVENALRDCGLQNVCGVDEAGRGPLAGPVVTAAVILNPGNIPDGLNDSKALNETIRLSLYHEILTRASVAISIASPARIDRLNIRAATLAAMKQSIERLPVEPDGILIDGNAAPPKLAQPAWLMIKGDSRSASIAAASIVAKTVRDDLMRKAHELWPQYGFDGHKGYPTAAHRAALQQHGPCPIHRQSFGPVRAATGIGQS